VVGGRYQLERPIGTGGMAKVWLAHDRLLDRRVAVKILADRYASDPGFVERFRREASAAAGLSHPNIVTVYDRGEADGSYYIVMEHLPGPDLKVIIRQHGRLAPRQAVDAALQVLAALSVAHRRDVIHRDIKPQNVLVAEDGHLKVTDFGIARAGDDAGMTEVGSVIGTAQYLSPEQARGEEVTPASDCYSVGILLYEMLTGRVPFDGDKPVAIAMRQINEPPISPRLLVPQIPPQLNEIVMKALEKRPGNRYRTAEEFTRALVAVRPTLPAPAEDATQVLAAVETPAPTRIIAPTTEPTRIATGRTPVPPPPPRRRRTPIILAILALLLFAGAAAVYLFTDVGRAAKVEIPSVVNQNEEAATALLEPDFRVKVRNDFDSRVGIGVAIGTDPPVGTRLAKGSEVVLIISQGPRAAVVPDVVGKKADDARQELEGFNFEVKLEEEFSDVEAGTVARQDPTAGSPLNEGEPVTLFVSKGQDLVRVPNLALKDRSEAAQILADAGLELGDETPRETSRRDPGTIVDQNPDAGTRAPKGSAVDITVAAAPATTPMPDVRRNDAASARTKLQANGFPDATTGADDCAEPDGTVVGQNPPPGTPVDPENQPVHLTVSDGTGVAPCLPATSGSVEPPGTTTTAQPLPGSG
jgi:serine/threonine-protein kinase